MSLPITIDGVDFSDLAEKNGYTVVFLPREGPNGGIMLSGDKTVDILRDQYDDPVYKALITWRFNALNGTQLARLQTAVLKPEVIVGYWNTRINDAYSGTFHPTLDVSEFAFERHGLKYFRDGLLLTLEEK